MLRAKKKRWQVRDRSTVINNVSDRKCTKSSYEGHKCLVKKLKSQDLNFFPCYFHYYFSIACASQNDNASTQIIHLTYTTAPQIASVLKRCLNADESAGGDKNILILKAISARVIELQKMIAELGQALKNTVNYGASTTIMQRSNEKIIASTKNFSNEENHQILRVVEVKKVLFGVGETRPVISSVNQNSQNININAIQISQPPMQVCKYNINH